MQYASTNSGMTTKMVVFQVGMTIFGLTMSIPGMISELLFILTGALAIGMYLFLLWTMTYEFGQRDRIRADAGRIRPKFHKGFTKALLANSVNIGLAVISLVSKLLIDNLAFFDEPVSEILYTPAWAAQTYAVTEGVANVIQAMYLAPRALWFPHNPIFLLLMPMPAIIVSGFGFYFGFMSEKKIQI